MFFETILSSYEKRVFLDGRRITPKLYPSKILSISNPGIFIDQINKSDLSILQEDRKVTIATHICNFYKFYDKFIKEQWHDSLCKDSHFIQEVSKTLELPLWETAYFLYHSGYSFIHSQKLVKFWQRWHNASEDIPDYLGWVKLCNSYSLKKIYFCDFIADYLVYNEKILPQSQICMEQPQCDSCLLNKECLFYKTHRTTPNDIRNKLLTNQAENIKNDEQLLLVAMESIEKNIVDGKVLLPKDTPDFCRAIQGNFITNSYQKYNDYWIIFWRAIKQLEKKKKNDFLGTKFTNSQQIFDFYKNYFRGNDKEEFKIICLDVKNELIHQHTISVGTKKMTLVDPIEVFAPAIQTKANSIILIHNHPSGSPQPSQEDIMLTKQLKEGAKILNLKILDHIIITEILYYSFSDERIL